MKKTKIIPVGILVVVILFACLGFLGYFGVKMMRRSHLQSEARKAFAAKDWKKAERLLKEYVELDRDAEEDFVRLAQVYRHFGNADEEMQCWYRASALNPLKPEYWNAYAESALKARDFQHLYTTLSSKVYSDAELAPKDRMLYLVCTVMTNRSKDAEKYYELMLKEDPEAFQRDELGRYAEFLATINKSSEDERSNFIERGIRSDDSFVRLESILFYLGRLESSGKDEDSILEEKESMLKQAAALNRFAGTPFLADFYFSRLDFPSVIEVAGPYLEDIVHIPLSVLYAESCVYGAQPEKLKPLAERYRRLDWRCRMLASYFDALYDFSQGSEETNDELAKLMQEVGGVIQSDLANLIKLQIALNNDSVEMISGSLETIMKRPPFYDLQERARSAVRSYLWNKIQADPALAGDPRMAKLAQLVSTPGGEDPFLMRLLITDLRKRNVLSRPVIREYLDAFPSDPYLLQVAAEFELFNDDPERCLEYTERFYALEDEEPSTSFDLLHMLALELSGKIDEAAKEFAALVDNDEMNLELLFHYLEFCSRYDRRTELAKMAERLNSSNVPELKALAPFFQAEDLFLQGKKEEALSLLETAKTDQPDFALYAANKFSSCDRAEEALSRYVALIGKHPDRRLILANVAEGYLAKGMKEEALSYARQAWEADGDDGLAQFVYAQMLAANGRYQDAEKVLKIPNRSIELSKEIRELWTDIMLHCVQEDFANRQFSRALERSAHFLVLYPDDPAFREFKTRAEQELKKAADARNSEQ